MILAYPHHQTLSRREAVLNDHAAHPAQAQPITMYTTLVCPYCVAAKNFLKSKNLQWTEVRIDTDPVERERMMARAKRTSVPQIFVGDVHIGENDRIAEFTAFRKRMNERILAEPNQVVRRFFALDTQTYQAGALDVKTKELLGLVASLVLRCDDCISYHVAQCKEAGVTRDEMFETFSVGLVVGGSIVIPHLRRAVDFLDRLEQGGDQAAAPAHDHG
jgi:GrxC family glutaredoxin